MGLLQTIGLGRKENPKKGELIRGASSTSREGAREELRDNIFRGAVFVGFLLLVILSLPTNSFRVIPEYSIDEPWRNEDLTADFTFAIRKSPEEIQAEQALILNQILPVFELQANARIASENRFLDLASQVQPVIRAYHAWVQSEAGSRGGGEGVGRAGSEASGRASTRSTTPATSSSSSSSSSASASSGALPATAAMGTGMGEAFSKADSERLFWVSVEEILPLDLPHSVWQGIVRGTTPTSTTSPFLDALTPLLPSLLDEIYAGRMINLEKSGVSSTEITVRDLTARTEQTISLANTLDPLETLDVVRFTLSRSLSPDRTQAAAQILNAILVPNLSYSPSETEKRQQEALQRISASKGAIAQGQVIIRRGDIVTPDKSVILVSYSDAKSSRASAIERWLRLIGEVIVVVSVSLVFFFYLFLYRRRIFEDPKNFFQVFLALSILILVSRFAYSLEDVSPYTVPMAIAPILLTIIFDSRVGLLSAITLSIITGIINDGSFEFLVSTATACSIGVFSVRDIKKRVQFFITTPGLVIASYLIILGGFTLSHYSGWQSYLGLVTPLLLNAGLILFTYPLILFFEKLFNNTTDFTLLELADTNLPLLKEFMSKAPGSFHHSLHVASLAEAAASDIGANALLVRVGALYHDIGKMNKPSYFVENQMNINQHDQLSPNISKMVIKEHVSKGEEIAEEHNLPDVIVDFIRTHHGTSLIRFFFDKAQKTKEVTGEIPEEDFRYDGPIPFTQEQGILMLADSIEAAARAMKEPTHKRLEGLIDRIVEHYVNDGQLDDCPLTFQDLKQIKLSFMKVLKGIYHSRIEYPAKEKSAKEETAGVEAGRAVMAEETSPAVQDTDGKPAVSLPDQQTSSD